MENSGPRVGDLVRIRVPASSHAFHCGWRSEDVCIVMAILLEDRHRYSTATLYNAREMIQMDFFYTSLEVLDGE
jgi:hypothetical protein